MPYGIQGQGPGRTAVAKMADFKVGLLCQYPCNQKTDGELWYSKTKCKFFLDRFVIFFLVRRHVTFKVSVPLGIFFMIFSLTVSWMMKDIQHL